MTDERGDRPELANARAASKELRGVSRAVAWVGAASSVIAVLDAIALGVMLAFWVTREDFGEASLAVTLFYFLDLATEAGLSSVLIQRAELDDKMISSVFWLNAMVSTVLFGAMFGIAPLVAWLQSNRTVGLMLIVYATKLVYQNVYFVPNALLRRELRFKELSIIRTIANFGDLGGRVGFAAAGEPVWCFVAGPLIRIAITGIGMQIARPWRPQLVFDRARSLEWLKYGAKTTSSQWLQHAYNNLGYQVVGYYFGTALTGTFRAAYELVLYPVNLVSNIVTQVAFPAFSRLHLDRKALAAQFMRFSRQNLAMTLPILVLLCVAASDVLAVLFPKYTDAATITRMLCLVGVLRAVDCLYLPLLDAAGVPGRNVLIAGVAAVVLLGADIVFSAALADRFGLVAVALGRIIGYPTVIALHAYLALQQLKLRARDYVKDFVGILACGLIAAVPGVLIEAFVDVRPGVRLPIVAAATLVTIGAALHYLQGLGPKAIVAALKGDKR